MSAKLPDEIAACNYIKRWRAYGKKNYLRKSLSVALPEYGLRMGIIFVYNKKTQCISFAHCLKFRRISIYPTTNQKLKCTNQHALEVLEQQRTRSRKRSRRNGYKN